MVETNLSEVVTVGRIGLDGRSPSSVPSLLQKAYLGVEVSNLCSVRRTYFELVPAGSSEIRF